VVREWLSVRMHLRETGVNISPQNPLLRYPVQSQLVITAVLPAWHPSLSAPELLQRGMDMVLHWEMMLKPEENLPQRWGHRPLQSRGVQLHWAFLQLPIV
ncbi:hypothetical protein ACJZAN_005407, partial [Escherichia coli]